MTGLRIPGTCQFFSIGPFARNDAGSIARVQVRGFVLIGECADDDRVFIDAD